MTERNIPDEDNFKHPDAYVKNSGVDVYEEQYSPQYGRVNVRIKHNQFQCSAAQIGLEQAKELRDKLNTLIAEIEQAEQRSIEKGDRVVIVTGKPWLHDGKTGVVDHILSGTMYGCPYSIKFDDPGFGNPPRDYFSLDHLVLVEKSKESQNG